MPTSYDVFASRRREQAMSALGRDLKDEELKKMMNGGDSLNHEQFQAFMGSMKEGTATEKEILDALEVFDKDKVRSARLSFSRASILSSCEQSPTTITTNANNRTARLTAKS